MTSRIYSPAGRVETCLAVVILSRGVYLWEMRSATVARVRDRNPMEIADDLGHRTRRLLPYGRLLAQNSPSVAQPYQESSR